jgi:hypothetical protein
MATYQARAIIGTRIHVLGTGLSLAEALAALALAQSEGVRVDSGLPGEAPHHVLVYPPHRIDQLEATREEPPPA